jgi:GntR family transcriptional regulator / MocR family aminotransferase
MLVPLTPGEPIYRQIYRFVRSEILSGHLPSGSRLPSTRALAADLNVSRTVVLLAFDQLMAEGYVHGISGSRTVVAAGIPTNGSAPGDTPGGLAPVATPTLSEYANRLLAEAAAGPPPPVFLKESNRYDFHYGNREAVDFPHKLWRRIAARRMAHAVPTRSPTAGYLPLREAIAAHLERTRAVRCDPEQVVIVNGSQQALDLFARLLINPGDQVVIEEPHYHGTRAVLHGVGASLLPCPVDEDGLCVDQLPARAHTIKAVFVTPSHQFPTGAVLPLPRRLALIEWVERHNAYIIEDDYDGELRYDCRPIEAVQALDRTGRVIYLGTFSKALSPELRLGYVVVPRQLLKPLLAAKWSTDLFASTLVQEVLADFMHAGHYDRHLRHLRERNAARRKALLDAAARFLGSHAVVAGVRAGLHAMIWLPGVPLHELGRLVARAEQRGVAVYPVTSYYLGSPPRSGIVASYASLSEAEITQGIRLFARALKSRR